eukprot:13592882-Alexandrium_andersonii.AAC.1
MGRLRQARPGQSGGQACRAAWEERPFGRRAPMVRPEILGHDRISECSGGASGGLGREVQRLALL